MSTVRKLRRISVEEYLSGERMSPIRHEYIDGVVYAMAGARNLHNVIGGNTFAALHARLRGRRCRAFHSDTKVRLRLPTQIRFYYPDASVSCRPNPPNDSFQDEPKAIFEVLARRTRRVDEGEKKDAYFTIPSLDVYVLVEQETARIIVYRRTEHGFVQELHEGIEAILPLPELAIELPLAEIYEGVEFMPEGEEEESPP
jgi:Uma2 family endonuclease